MRVRALGVAVLLLGLLVGIGYQSVPLRTGTDTICQNRTETVPAGLEASPALSFRGSSYRVLPAELRCNWVVDGEPVVTELGMNPGADLIAGVLLGAGLVLVLLPRSPREHARTRTSGLV